MLFGRSAFTFSDSAPSFCGRFLGHSALMFDWMPIIFTFMLAGFSSGLVIYWAWNNSLSVAQQSIIMKKHGAKIELWSNIKALWPRNLPALWEKIKELLRSNKPKL